MLDHFEPPADEAKETVTDEIIEEPVETTDDLEVIPEKSETTPPDEVGPEEKTDEPDEILIDSNKVYKLSDGSLAKGDQILSKSIYTQKTQEEATIRKQMEEERKSLEPILETGRMVQEYLKTNPHEFVYKLATELGGYFVDKDGNLLGQPKPGQPDFTTNYTHKQTEERAKAAETQLSDIQRQTLVTQQANNAIAKYGEALTDDIGNYAVSTWNGVTPLDEHIDNVMSFLASRQPQAPQAPKPTVKKQPAPATPREKDLGFEPRGEFSAMYAERLSKK